MFDAKARVLVAAVALQLLVGEVSALSGQQQERLVPNGTATIQVFTEGAGPTVVLLPSLGRGAEDFADLTERLVRAGIRVVRPQPRGVGRSSGPMDDLTLHDLSGDVAAAIRAVGGAPVTVIGHAYGNRVARMVATDYPDLVRQVVLIAAGGRVPMASDVAQALMRSFDGSLPRDEHLASVARAFFANGRDPVVWEGGWYQSVQEAESAANRATPVADWWAGGTAPLLVLQGTEDVVAPPGNAEALREEFGDRVSVVEIPHAGHAMLPEQPELIANAIIEFVNR